MCGMNRVILACFTAALQDLIANTPGLSVGAHVDARRAIRCVEYLTDFCLMAQYRSHTPQTIGYMDQYLQKFHDSVQVFSEFRATKKDWQDAKEASRGLAAGLLETYQAKLQEYFGLSATQRNKLAVED